MNMKFPAGQRYKLFFEKRMNARDSIRRKLRDDAHSLLIFGGAKIRFELLVWEDVTHSVTDCQWGNTEIYV